MIVDDNIELVNTIADSLQKDGRFKIIGKYLDGESGVNAIIEKKPDIVILDILLPERDGIGVLEKYNKNKEINDDMVFIILTAVAQEAITRRVLEIGADYIILKPFNMDILIKRMIEQYNIRKQYPNSEFIYQPIKKKGKEEYITDILKGTGIPVNLKGYRYLKSAINLSMEDDTLLTSITKLLYPTVAKHCNTTASRVERDIRHSLEVAWSRGDGSFYYNFIGFDSEKKEKPTNGAFISSVVEKAKIYFSDEN